MTDFRALCSVLIDDLELCDWPYKLKKTIRDDIDRARAALAEPEPEGPTLDDILELCADHEFMLGVDGANEEESAKGLLEIARAVLARWGNPAPLADTHYEWELVDAEGEWQAGGSSNSQTDVEREGMRYLQTYTQDGPHKLIIRQHTTQTINEIVHLETQDEPYVKDHIPFA